VNVIEDAFGGQADFAIAQAGFSRKLENHAAAVALNYFAYNFIKIHRTLRMSPAMAAGVTDRLWDVNELWPFGSSTNGGRKGWHK